MSSKQSTTSRRATLAGGAGIAFGTTFQSSGEGMAATLVDPRTKYPQPPFKEQQQPWPGLASK